mmetsp:Transcript_30521/g.93338  ORF Transcript_30521/g.93338 Transcript_30521/m.93338 type:complete len:138 (+) Transcript_30521:395-808(+)|eukprot:scaffold189029_cov33-Tisochrysis_lutea.AAC.2
MYRVSLSHANVQEAHAALCDSPSAPHRGQLCARVSGSLVLPKPPALARPRPRPALPPRGWLLRPRRPRGPASRLLSFELVDAARALSPELVAAARVASCGPRPPCRPCPAESGVLSAEATDAERADSSSPLNTLLHG